MAVDELDNSLPLEPPAGAAHSLERQSQVVRDIRAAHRQRDIAATAGVTLFLQQAQQHCEPTHGVAPPDDDGVVLRLPQHMDNLAEKLQLDVGVALEQLGE